MGAGCRTRRQKRSERKSPIPLPMIAPARPPMSAESDGADRHPDGTERHADLGSERGALGREGHSPGPGARLADHLPGQRPDVALPDRVDGRLDEVGDGDADGHPDEDLRPATQGPQQRGLDGRCWDRTLDQRLAALFEGPGRIRRLVFAPVGDPLRLGRAGLFPLHALQVLLDRLSAVELGAGPLGLAHVDRPRPAFDVRRPTLHRRRGQVRGRAGLGRRRPLHVQDVLARRGSRWGRSEPSPPASG